MVSIAAVIVYGVPDDDLSAFDDELLSASSAGVRVFWISAPSKQELVTRMALILGEHLQLRDELHVSYNAIQNSSTTYPGRAGTLLQDPVAPWTELGFEYSVMLVLRHATPSS